MVIHLGRATQEITPTVHNKWLWPMVHFSGLVMLFEHPEVLCLKFVLKNNVFNHCNFKVSKVFFINIVLRKYIITIFEFYDFYEWSLNWINWIEMYDEVIKNPTVKSTNSYKYFEQIIYSNIDFTIQIKTTILFPVPWNICLIGNRKNQRTALKDNCF